MAMMTELSHLEGIITQLDKHTADPFSLPLSTEQVISPHLHIISMSMACYSCPHSCLITPPLSFS